MVLFPKLNKNKEKNKNKMTKKQIRTFSAEYKTKIVLELLESGLTTAQVSKKYEIASRTLQNWRSQFIKNASIAFEPATVVSEYKARIQDLQDQNDKLAKTLGKTTVERDWAVGKLKSLDTSNRRSLVDSKLEKMSKTRQCELLNLNRSMLYYKPKIMSMYNKNILNRIDEIYTENPDYGYRFMHKQLLEDGFYITPVSFKKVF